MARFFRSFVLVCGACGHHNMPHKSPREGIRLALTGKLPPCRGCGTAMNHVKLTDRPLVNKVRAELIAEGVAPVC